MFNLWAARPFRKKYENADFQLSASRYTATSDLALCSENSTLLKVGVFLWTREGSVMSQHRGCIVKSGMH